MPDAMPKQLIDAIAPYIISHHSMLEMAADEIAPIVGCTTEQAQKVIDDHNAYLAHQAEMAEWHFLQENNDA